jgi:phosphopantetheine--protein transferase-like protein
VSLVGNDVVDLGDSEISTSHLRERFVARVLSLRERESFERAPDAKVCLWAHFAAKEAAYKVLVKSPGAALLAHRQFEVAEDFSSVRHRETTLRLEVECGGAFVHAVAWAGPERPRWGVATVAAGDDSSLAVRGLLLTELGGGAGLAVVRTPIPGSWDGFGPPRVMDGNVPLEVDVSLSHDGRFVAWAVVGCTSQRCDRRSAERSAPTERDDTVGR